MSSFTLVDEDGAYVECSHAIRHHRVEFYCPSTLVWAEIDAARTFAFSLLELCDTLSFQEKTNG